MFYYKMCLHLYKNLHCDKNDRYHMIEENRTKAPDSIMTTI